MHETWWKTSKSCFPCVKIVKTEKLRTATHERIYWTCSIGSITRASSICFLINESNWVMFNLWWSSWWNLNQGFRKWSKLLNVYFLEKIVCMHSLCFYPWIKNFNDELKTNEEFTWKFTQGSTVSIVSQLYKFFIGVQWCYKGKKWFLL